MLNTDDEKTKKQADDAYEELTDKGVEVLYDDREDVSAGEKFADWELIGNPLRVVVSKNTKGKFELRRLGEDAEKLVEINDIVKAVSELI